MKRCKTAPRKTRQRRPESPDALTVSVERAAAQIGVSRNFLYEQVAAGAVPCVKLGSRIRIAKATIAAILAAATVTPERAAEIARGQS